MRLLSSPPTPRDRFTKDTMKKPSHVEHVVIVGYYQKFLPMLISEMKEESSDYLQDTICRRNISWWEIVVILTQEKVKVPEMTAMCGRFASHVQIIEGSPVDIISMCLQIRLSFIITLLVFMLNSLMLIRCMWFLIQLGGDYSASSFIL